MAGRRNFIITKGDDFITDVFLQDTSGAAINITGRTYTAQVRKIASSTGAPDASFVCVVTSGVGGQVTMTLPHAQTEILDATDYFWDLEQDNAGIITTLLSGKISVEQDVTK